MVRSCEFNYRNKALAMYIYTICKKVFFFFSMQKETGSQRICGVVKMSLEICKGKGTAMMLSLIRISYMKDYLYSIGIANSQFLAIVPSYILTMVLGSIELSRTWPACLDKEKIIGGIP